MKTDMKDIMILKHRMQDFKPKEPTPLTKQQKESAEQAWKEHIKKK